MHTKTGITREAERYARRLMVKCEGVGSCGAVFVIWCLVLW